MLFEVASVSYILHRSFLFAVLQSETKDKELAVKKEGNH